MRTMFVRSLVRALAELDPPSFTPTEFLQGLNLEHLDDEKHRMVPYSLVVLRYLLKWRAQVWGHPSSRCCSYAKLQFLAKYPWLDAGGLSKHSLLRACITLTLASNPPALQHDGRLPTTAETQEIRAMINAGNCCCAWAIRIPHAHVAVADLVVCTGWTQWAYSFALSPQISDASRTTPRLSRITLRKPSSMSGHWQRA